MVTLRDAFERALEKKKKYIGGLLNELEEGEEQYSMAFRAQMENIERMMGVHQVMMMVLMMVIMIGEHRDREDNGGLPGDDDGVDNGDDGDDGDYDWRIWRG